MFKTVINTVFFNIYFFFVINYFLSPIGFEIGRLYKCVGSQIFLLHPKDYLLPFEHSF